jgi:xanthine dehydrogenase accessory factor
MLDLQALAAALAGHGRIARVVIAGVEGSSPREVGASMLVWEDGQSGTIGGGALEFEAAARARGLLCTGGTAVQRVALGPTLGQCCGGAVTLWTEVFDALPLSTGGMVARGPGEMPLSVRRILSAARGQGLRPATALVQGWLVEPVAEPARKVWIWGAGHVGRALITVLAPMPEFALTWVDVAAERFPAEVPPNVTTVTANDPAVIADHAPPEAEHLVLTFSHALDLELCHRLLRRGFRSCGLIGSATKWARFRSRLGGLGHDAANVARIRCPIGDPALGKHPQAIAVGVVAELLKVPAVAAREKRA